jgi:iron(III) transport system substrate-binding protein
MHMPRSRRWLAILPALALTAAALAACGGDDDDGGDGSSDSLIVYSGRSEGLVGPIIEQFSEDTGIDVDVKYGDTAQLAALLVEEGDSSPADVYFAQDGGALGAVSNEGLFDTLPAAVLDKVDPAFRSDDGHWVGISGRARVIVYNPKILAESDVPASVDDLVDPEWEDRVGWAPTNGSFQAFVTALRQIEGEEAAKKWLEDMQANGVRAYENNVAIVNAVAAGEIELGIVNHYYLYGFIRDQGEDFNARNHFTAANDAGSLVNVAGVGVIASSDHKDAALQFIEFLLSDEGQHYFSEETFEYPLVTGIEPDPRLTPLSELDPPDIDLSDLDDLEGTLDLLRSTGVLS